MARVNIFIGEDLLQDADAEANRQGMKRSALFRKALVRYLEEQRQSREEAEAHRRMEGACRRMNAIAEKLGDWDPTKVIRDFRDRRPESGDGASRRSETRRKRA